MFKLSTVTVNYNGGDFIVDCIKALLVESNGVTLDIWVVDNASTDGSKEKLKKVFTKIHFIENKENRGFAAANNQALRKIKNEYILMINPDTRVEKGTLNFMLNFMEENSQVGVSTCKVVHNDGSLDWASHRGLPTPLASLLYFLGNDKFYHLSDRDMSEAHEVDAVSGSFFLTRKSVLNKVGLFDEAYWMYAEDIDLCYRIKQEGYKIMYVPKVQVLHLKGASSGIKKHSSEISSATRASKQRAFNAFYQTMKIFYRKNMAKNYPFFVNWLVYLGIDMRQFLAKRKMAV